LQLLTPHPPFYALLPLGLSAPVGNKRYICISNLYVCMSILHVCMHVCKHMVICICIYLYIYMYIYIYINTCMYIYVYICIYIYIYMYTYIYLLLLRSNSGCFHAGLNPGSLLNSSSCLRILSSL
jgi:hypothetical protein